MEQERKEPINNIYISLCDENIGLEEEIPKDVVPLEPIESWGNRRLLYGQLNNWLSSTAFYLSDRYDQYQEFSGIRFFVGMSNPSNFLYSISMGNLYIQYKNFGSETVAVNRFESTKKINPHFTEELMKVSFNLQKYGKLRAKEEIDIPYWGEVTARILNNFAKYSNFTHQAITISPLEAKKSTDALLSLNRNLSIFKALDQK